MSKLKILVVDDEARMRKLVKDFLIRKDYEVIEAADGEDFFCSGVKLIKNSRTSTVINMIVESAYISGLIPLRTSL